MNKEVINIIVPEGQCPMDKLAELKEDSANAWIFFHESAIERIKESGEVTELLHDAYEVEWKETDEHPATRMWVHRRRSDFDEVVLIEADDIAFTVPASNPEKLIYVYMDTV